MLLFLLQVKFTEAMIFVEKLTAVWMKSTLFWNKKNKKKILKVVWDVLKFFIDDQELRPIKLLISCSQWSDLLLQALDLVPTKIHERSPIFLGSYDDVEEIKQLYAAEGKKE